MHLELAAARVPFCRSASSARRSTACFAHRLIEHGTSAICRWSWPGTWRCRRRGAGRPPTRCPHEPDGDADAGRDRSHRVPVTVSGSASTSRMRSATCSAFVGCRHALQQDDELIAAEARESCSGRGSARRRPRRACRLPAGCATVTSSSSPARWPRLSLTTLKRSRSRNSTA